MILHAVLTSSPRREYWLGGPTVKAILGQRIIPGLLDIYLGKTSYQAQQREEADPPERPNNVWHPVATTMGTHGPFDQQSRPFSLEAELSRHRGWIMAALGIVGAVFCARKLLAR